MSTIYIIIVTYNAMKWAERCFSSLRKSSIPVKTIVVDNGSTDGTQDFIKTNFSEVDFIQANENLGFGKANNLGIEKAYKEGADFFYLMNQDAWIFEDSIQKMIDVYNAFPNKNEIGILSPMHLDGSEQQFDLHFEMYLSRNITENRAFSDVFCGHPKPFYEMIFVNAAHWLIPKRTIEEVGGFNPYFFQGVEDHEYANRLKFKNKKIFICTQSKVVHDAKKGFLRGDSKENTRKASLRAQRESRYLNPSYQFNIKNEKKEFYSNIIKLALKGNTYESKFYRDMLNYFKPRFQQIEKARKIAMTEKNPFLNL